jgi:hypothetical protein
VSQNLRIREVGLRRLIREIAAIAQLKAMQETDAFEKAAVEASKSTFKSAKSLDQITAARSIDLDHRRCIGRRRSGTERRGD